jgi:hypothetical protein
MTPEAKLLDVAAVDVDGLFSWQADDFVLAGDSKDRPIVADSRCHRADFESAKFPFENKSPIF